jgi:hypothetical protein
MTTQPALTALALVELIERHLRQPTDTDARTEELRALLADDDGDVHADTMVNVANELAMFVVAIAARANVSLEEFIGYYRRALIARDDDDEG